MLLPHQALTAIYAHLTPLPARRRPLRLACGACLAEDILADRDMPAADRAAMDGYAVQASDLQAGPRALRLIGEVAAGQRPRVRVVPGTCVSIMTGASVPAGADTVVMQEETERRGDTIRVAAAVPGQHILRQGEDTTAGTVVLRRGTVLNPLQIGLCAAVGRDAVRVHRRPTVRVLCSGTELREAGETVQPHQVRNTNGPALTAALDQWGFGRPAHTGVPDRLEALVAELSQAIATADVVLLTGGMSAGRYDLARQAVEAVGLSVVFHGVAMKPGKPLLFASRNQSHHLFGLPGPPLSAMVGFFEFVLPALRRLAGLEPADCQPRLYLPLSAPLASKGGRVRLVPASVQYGHQGLLVTPVPARSSSDLVSSSPAAGAIVVPPDTSEMAAGEQVEFDPWRPFL